MPNKKEVIQSLLSEAQITLNGNGNADIQINNSGFYNRVLREGVLGFGESYMDGWWDVQKPDDLFYRLINASLHEKVKS